MDGIYTETAELLDTFKRYRYYKKELDTVNLKEECGDVLWYIVCKFHIQEFSLFSFGDISHARFFNSMGLKLAVSPTMNQTIRKFIKFMIPKFEEDELMNNIALARFIELMESMDFELADVCNVNIAKLEARYNKKVFDAEQANNRDLVAERIILES